MNRWNLKRAGVMALVLGLGWVVVQPAEAVPFRMRVMNVALGQGITITDNGAGDLNAALGAVTVTTAIPGGFSITVQTGTSKPVIGGVTNAAELAFSGVEVQSSAGGGTLLLMLEDGDYTIQGAPQLSASVGGVLTGLAGSSIMFNSWANDANLVPALGADVSVPGIVPVIGATPAGSVEAFGGSGITFGPGAFSATSAMAAFPHDAPYALFSQVRINFTGPGSASWSLNQQIASAERVPEPSTLLLTALGVPAVLLRRLRRPASR